MMTKALLVLKSYDSFSALLSCYLYTCFSVMIVKGGCHELCTAMRFVTSRGEDLDLGPETRLDHLELFV